MTLKQWHLKPETLFHFVYDSPAVRLLICRWGVYSYWVHSTQCGSSYSGATKKLEIQPPIKFQASITCTLVCLFGSVKGLCRRTIKTSPLHSQKETHRSVLYGQTKQRAIRISEALWNFSVCKNCILIVLILSQLPWKSKLQSCLLYRKKKVNYLHQLFD